MHFRTLAFACLALLPASLSAQEMTRDPMQVPAGTYTLDPAHGKITWGVNHLGFSTYYGQITGVQATLVLDPQDLSRTRLSATVDPTKVVSNDAELDAHLRNKDFFNVSAFPTVSFTATEVKRTGEHEAEITGQLTLLGVTKPFAFRAVFNQAGLHPVDKTYTVGFTGRGVLVRSQYGMTAFLPGLGDEVSLELEGEFKAAR